MRTLGLVLGINLACLGVALAQETERPPLPALSVSLGSALYPSAALKAELQGRALVEFSIDKKGRVDNATLLEAEPVGQFESTALTVVKKVRFTVPDDWRDSGATEQRYRLSVLFKLSPCEAPACVAPVAHDGADDFLIVSAQRK